MARAKESPAERLFEEAPKPHYLARTSKYDIWEARPNEVGILTKDVRLANSLNRALDNYYDARITASDEPVFYVSEHTLHRPEIVKILGIKVALRSKTKDIDVPPETVPTQSL